MSFKESWSVESPNQEQVAKLQHALGVHSITAQCLVTRGIVDSEQARAYLKPTLAGLRVPEGLAGLQEALPRLIQAAQGAETVGVFGDYDVDGVTTTTLLSEALEAFGAKVIPMVASRAAGYGFGVSQAEALLEKGCTLIVTGDCGTSDIPSIEAANASGCDVIIIDHHTVPDADKPHPAFALINPFCADSTFPFQGMASVGLAFYVMGALRTALRERGHFSGRRSEPDVCSWLDLVALGTVADLVPLTHENRIMTTEGMARMARRTRPGIAALLEVAGVKASEKITEHTIGWKLGPRLNAPGRLGDAQASLDVLRAKDAPSAKAAAQVVETINQERRAAQDIVFRQAMEKLGDVDPGPAVVVAGEGWAHGVVGIIASRLVDHYQRPAVVIAINAETGEGRGSARSFGGVNLYDALASCSELLGRFGGHAAAAGLSMQATDISVFTSDFHKAVVSQSPELLARYQCDANVSADQISESLVAELSTLAPFGKGNAQPLFVSQNVEVRSTRKVGGGGHLKLTLVDSKGRELSAIAFGMGDRDPGPGAVVDIAYVPAISTWGGRDRLEFMVKDFWPRES